MKSITEIINENLNIKNCVIVPTEIIYELVDILDKFKPNFSKEEQSLYNDFLDVLQDEKSGNYKKLN